MQEIHPQPTLVDDLVDVNFYYTTALWKRMPELMYERQQVRAFRSPPIFAAHVFRVPVQ